MATEILLADCQLERLADLLAERLANSAHGELIDAAELAKRIGRSREFVYDHAAALGAVRLGAGARPRIMFRWPHVLDLVVADCKPRVPPQKPSARKSKRTRDVELLPIAGKR